MNNTEKFAQIIPLVEELYKKYPAYVSMTFTLGTNHHGNLHEPYVNYNIYTPELSHKRYTDFESFVAFIRLVLSDGVNNIRIDILEKQIKTAKANIESQERIIANCEKDLKKTPSMLQEILLGKEMADAFDKVIDK